MNNLTLDTEVQNAVNCMLKSGTILYPTDTIWGIGCDATNSRAIEKIYNIKQRQADKSMLILLSSISQIKNYVHNFSLQAEELIKQTQSPLTIIFPNAKNLPANLLAYDSSIGIRITTDELCCRIINRLGKPLVSTSANLSGETYPNSFDQINNQIVQTVDYIVKWRQTEQNKFMPSRIVKITETNDLIVIRN